MEPRSEAPLSERYQLGPVIGTGSFGVVYRAWDRVRGEPVALKQLRRTTPHALYRFKQEFRAVADVRHPNLVRLHELRAEGDQWFLAMELVEGVGFLEWVRHGVHTARADATFVDSDASFPPLDEERPREVGTVDEARLRAALGQLAEGVAALHATGTLHRDLKPNNVLVTPEGRVVVLDFSLVTDLEVEEQSRAIGGTPLYMAPEHMDRVPLTAAADWYSVGVMLYEALTGLRPFSGSRIEVLSQKSATRPASPSQVVAGLPADLVDLCDELMQIDPEARPSGAEVLARLGVKTAAPPVPGGRAPFVGRGPQLDALLAAFTAARTSPVVRVVEGPSGMGKSALVRHFFRSLPGSVVTVTGRCYEREAVRFKGVDSLVDGLARHLRQLAPEVQEALRPRHTSALVQVFPVLGSVERLARRESEDAPDPVSRDVERRRAFAALREMMGRIADRWPLALFVDDVQWSDADSAALLTELLRPPDAPPLLLILACRREDLDTNAVLSRLLLLSRDEQEPLDLGFVHVDPLSPEESRQLAESLAGARSVDEIVADSGGNPYFLDQLARRAQRAAPSSLDALLRERAAELPPGALRLLEGVAVAGRPLAAAVAMEAGGITDEAVVRAVLDAHLLRMGGDERTLEIWHDRVREAVAEAVPPEEVRAWHLRFADVIERRGKARAPESPASREGASGRFAAETLAAHLLAAGRIERAREWCLRAGDEAMAALAFERAAAHYADALACGAEASTTHVKRAEALAAAGRGAAAAREQLAAAETAPPGLAQSLRADAALQLLVMHQVQEGMAVLGDALRRIGHPLPSTPWRSLLSLAWRRAWLRVRGLGFRERPESTIDPARLAVVDTLWAATVGLATFNQIRSADYHARGLLHALAAGEPRRMARAVAMEMLHTGVTGSRRAARVGRLAEQAEALAIASKDPRILAGYAINRGIVDYLLGRFADARQRLLAAEAGLLALPEGRAWERDNLHRFLMRTLSLLGELRELGGLLREMVRDAEARGEAAAAAHVQLRTGYLLRMAADDVEGAEEDADRFMAELAQPGFQIQNLVHLVARTELALYEGAVVLAWNRLEEAWPTLVRTLLLRVQVTRVEAAFLRGRAALAVLRSLRADDARRARFLVVIREERDALLAERVAWSVALGELLDGGLARATNEADADARIRRAADRCAAADLRLIAALARHAVGGPDSAGAAAWLAEQGVVDPTRLARVYLP